MTHRTPSLSCSCCETRQADRAFLLPLKLVTAPYRDALLCDACIETCNEILEEEGIATDAVPVPSPMHIHAPRSPFHHHQCSFCGREEVQVMRLIALLHDMRMCNLCVGACNAAAIVLNKERMQATMEQPIRGVAPQPSSPEPITMLQELDLGQHTLFVMSDGSIDLIAHDEHTSYLADHGITLSRDEAYRLFTCLHEHFKQKEPST